MSAEWWVTCGSYAALIEADTADQAKREAFRVFFGKRAAKGLAGLHPHWVERARDLAVRPATEADKARVASYRALQRALKPKTAAEPSADAQRLFP